MSDRHPLVAQRLVDPEICTACYGCYEACPTGAIHIRHRQVTIDPNLCNDCRACVDECGTGAIDVVRWVPMDLRYSLDDQFSWDSLPAEDIR